MMIRVSRCRHDNDQPHTHNHPVHASPSTASPIPQSAADDLRAASTSPIRLTQRTGSPGSAGCALTPTLKRPGAGRWPPAGSGGMSRPWPSRSARLPFNVRLERMIHQLMALFGRVEPSEANSQPGEVFAVDQTGPGVGGLHESVLSWTHPVGDVSELWPRQPLLRDAPNPVAVAEAGHDTTPGELSVCRQPMIASISRSGPTENRGQSVVPVSRGAGATPSCSRRRSSGWA